VLPTYMGKKVLPTYVGKNSVAYSVTYLFRILYTISVEFVTKLFVSHYAI